MIRRLLTVVLVLWLLPIGLWLSGFILGWKGVWENTDDDRLGHSAWDLKISGGGVCLSESRQRVLPDEKDFAQLYRRNRSDPPYRHWGREESNDYPSRWGSAPSRWVLQWKKSREPPYLLTYRTVIFPGWALLLPAAALIAVWLGSRRKPRVSGHCMACGYDLRAGSGHSLWPHAAAR